MTKTDLGIYSILALFTIAGAALLYITFSHESIDTNTNSKKIAQDGFLYNMRNDVRVKRPTDVSWRETLDELGLEYDSKVFVGPKSTAWIRTPMFQAHIEENSLFSLTKQKKDSALTFEKGTLQVELAEKKPVLFTIGTKTIQMSGNSKILLNRNENAKNSNVGISVIEGEVSISSGNQKLITTKAGESYEIKSSSKDQNMVVESLTITLLPKKREIPFFENQPVIFEWKAPIKKFKSVVLQLSQIESFSTLFQKHSVKSDSLTLDKLPVGKYFWRLRADTGTTEIFSPSRQLEILAEVPSEQNDPLFMFQTPTVWQVDFRAKLNPYAENYHFELSSNELFQKTLLFSQSKNPNTKSLLTYIGPIFARSRYKYRGINYFSTWSPPKLITNLTLQPSPQLTAVEPLDLKGYPLTWNKVPNSEFYKLFRYDTLTENLLTSRDIKTSLDVGEMQNRRQTTVTVRSHRSKIEYGFDSNKIILKGYVDSPKLASAVVLPKWLPRFSLNQKPRLNLKFSSDITESEHMIIDVSDNIEMKNSIQIKGTPRKVDFEFPVPEYKKYFFKSLIVVDKETLLTESSQAFEIQHPVVTKLPEVQLNLPRENEELFSASLKFIIDFQWKKSADETNWDFELAEDIGFKKILAKTEVAAPRYIYKNKFKNGKYFWRVRSFNKIRDSEWSKARAFGITNAAK
jgi:hypothetical protein